MKIAFKFILSLVLALLLAWAIRTYAFTVFSVPVGGLPPQLKEGNRVIVNRLDCDNFKRGDQVVFADSVECESNEAVSSITGRSFEMNRTYKFWEERLFIGRIVKMPGDTIQIHGTRYEIPSICCDRCGCRDCKYFLVRTCSGLQLVHKHQMIGKAYKLF